MLVGAVRTQPNNLDSRANKYETAAAHLFPGPAIVTSLFHLFAASTSTLPPPPLASTSTYLDLSSNNSYVPHGYHLVSLL